MRSPNKYQWDFSGRFHLPRTWRALVIERTENGMIVRRVRKPAHEIVIDWAERVFRKHVWPYLGGKR
jgi:hypothetical protein